MIYALRPVYGGRRIAETCREKASLTIGDAAPLKRWSTPRSVGAKSPPHLAKAFEGIGLAQNMTV